MNTIDISNLTSVETINIVDMIATVSILIFIIIPIAIIYFFYRAYKGSVKRSKEKLNLEKQQTIRIQQQVDELHNRLEKVEKLLKEVD